MRAWKEPYRRNNLVSEPFNSGVVKIYDAVDIAEPGKKPVKRLLGKLTLRYEERKLGIQRYYAGKQNQVDISRVIRVPKPGASEITNQQIAETEDGARYRIDLVQAVRDSHPQCYDLTLVRIYQTEEFSV